MDTRKLKNISNNEQDFLNNVNRIIGKLDLYDSYDMTNSEIRNLHDQLLELIHKIKCEKLTRCLLNNLQLKNYLTDLNATLHSVTEISIAKNFISTNNDELFSRSWINKGFKDLLNGQISIWETHGLIPKGRPAEIAIIGGGALPQTQIFLHENLRCNVVSIERDEQSANLSKEVLRKLNYGNLSVIETDGVDFCYNGYDITVVATLVQQKNAIAKRIFNTSQSYFCPRSPFGLHSIWREQIEIEQITNLGYKLINQWLPGDSAVESFIFGKTD